MAVERVPLTPEGHEKLKKEIKHLRSVEQPKIVQEIEEARAHGDLSENAEYHAAKEKAGHIKGRIMDLEGQLSLAEVIDPKTLQGQTRIMFGAHVTLVDTDDERESRYQIVGDYEADIAQKKISVSSPIARGLIGKSQDDVVTIKTPKGPKEYEILKVEYL